MLLYKLLVQVLHTLHLKLTPTSLTHSDHTETESDIIFQLLYSPRHKSVLT